MISIGKVKIIVFQFLLDCDSAFVHPTGSYRTTCMPVTHFNADMENFKDFGKTTN